MTAVRVAVVDDSSFIRMAVVRMLEGDPRFEVVGTARSGEELLERLEEWRPDVITLDLSMPGMGGLRTLDHIMAERPRPVIVLSGRSRDDAPLAIEALHRGAVDFLDKRRYSLVDFEALRDVLVRRILEVSGRAAADPEPAAAPPPAGRAPAPARKPSRRGIELVVVGASTGGPVAIQELLADLGTGLPAPVVIAQHMPPGFTRAFAERLNSRLALSVREAGDGESLLPETVYIAPAGRQLQIDRRGGTLYARLREADAAPGVHQPSVDVLFESAARVAGDAVLAVLLTGMGRDGARGMAALAAAGAHTVAQDEATSVVWGMPRAAAELQAVRETLPLAEIGPRVRRLLDSGDPDG